MFEQHFVKNGTFSHELSLNLRKAFDERLRSDYFVKYSANYDDAENAVKRAERFVASIKRYLKKEVYKTS